MTFIQKCKKTLWNFLYPFFPYIEHLFLFVHKRERQPFHIGWLAEGMSLHDMKKHLSEQYEFGNHFVAWEDPDQVLSWRKLDGFEYQYHIRVFTDGEIRGHYERTPEAAPLRHFLEKGEQACLQTFIQFLGPFVQQEVYRQNPLLTPERETKTEVVYATPEK